MPWLTINRSFLGQAPIIAACLLCISGLSISTRKQESDRQDEEGNDRARIPKEKRAVDFAGIAAFTVMLISFLLAITIMDRTSHVAPKSYATALLAVSSVAATALFLIERDYAKTPLIPLELLEGSLGLQMIVQVMLLFAQFAVRPSVPAFRDLC